MPKGQSYSAGTNRSGTKRKSVMSKDNTGDEPEAGSELRERTLGESRQAVMNSCKVTKKGLGV